MHCFQSSRRMPFAAGEAAVGKRPCSKRSLLLAVAGAIAVGLPPNVRAEDAVGMQEPINQFADKMMQLQVRFQLQPCLTGSGFDLLQSKSSVYVDHRCVFAAWEPITCALGQWPGRALLAHNTLWGCHLRVHGI
jgi:hypothetical protein